MTLHTEMVYLPRDSPIHVLTRQIFCIQLNHYTTKPEVRQMHLSICYLQIYLF